MTQIVLTSKVGSDGVLHLTLPLTAADQEVRVTVEPVIPNKEMSTDEWRAFILSTASSIRDPAFERPPQRGCLLQHLEAAWLAGEISDSELQS